MVQMVQYRTSVSSVDRDDPLEAWNVREVEETELQRSQRRASEEEARRVSEGIDADLARQHAQLKKQDPIKILLLGQSESGKSTTIKNFQLMHSAKAFRDERRAWRSVIQLNVIRSVRLILETMTEEESPGSPSSGWESLPGVASPSSRSPSLSYTELRPRMSSSILSTEHLRLKRRLGPVLEIEDALLRRLSQAGESEATRVVESTVGQSELVVQSRGGPLSRFLGGPPRNSEDSRVSDDMSPDASDPGQILHACRDDLMALWKDEVVQTLLRKKGVRLVDLPGFFLDDLERVTQLDYVPTNDDILRARVKTMGVTEYRFKMSHEKITGPDWRIYDVGGARSLISLSSPSASDAWIPFFDDVHAIIFLAPISCFDQVLVEDDSVNRLEDSVLLWKTVCSNALLQKSSLILFLNKVDVLTRKLKAGLKLGKYVLSYGDRPNDVQSVSSYLQRKFQSIQQQCSSSKRPFYCHLTTAIDTKSTSVILVRGSPEQSHESKPNSITIVHYLSRKAFLIMIHG